LALVKLYAQRDEMLALRTVQRLSCMQPSAMARLSTRASSIPLINQVVENKTASPVCLVEHPYVLDGYKTPGVLQEKRDVFAVVDFSGTQYKVVNVRIVLFSPGQLLHSANDIFNCFFAG
jgi:hypothetical protein